MPNLGLSSSRLLKEQTAYLRLWGAFVLEQPGKVRGELPRFDKASVHGFAKPLAISKGGFHKPTATCDAAGSW